jgi:predicted nucleic acid-binding protein
VTFQIERAPIVVDASIAVGVLAGEAKPVEAWERWTDELAPLIAPTILAIEIANALVRGHRVPAASVVAQLRAILDGGIELADRGLNGIVSSIALADVHGLSVYDAIYLWLAIDVDGELATFDRALAAAALAEGVRLAEGLEDTAS